MLVRVSVRSLWDPPRPPCYPGPLPELVITQDKQRPPSPKFVTNGIIDWQTLSFSRAAGLLSVALARRNTFNLIEKHWGCEGGGHAAIGEIKRWDSFNDSPPPPPPAWKLDPQWPRVSPHSDLTTTVHCEFFIVIFFFFLLLWNHIPVGYVCWHPAGCFMSISVSQINSFVSQTALAGWLAGWLVQDSSLGFFCCFF